MNWKVIAIKLGRKLEKLLRKLARDTHEDAVAEINRNRLAQVRNPRPGKWQVIDRDKGEIIGTTDEAEEGIEVVG